MFLPQEIVRKKRDGQALSQEDVAGFVRGITEGSVTEGQVAAFAMAVYFNDMSIDERVALTLAQRDSGQVLQWRSFDLPGPVLDKHSTGGVGDLTSLLLGCARSGRGGRTKRRERNSGRVFVRGERSGRAADRVLPHGPAALKHAQRGGQYRLFELHRVFRQR